MPRQPPGSRPASPHKATTTAFDVLYPPPRAPTPDPNAPAVAPEGGPPTQAVRVFWRAPSTPTTTPADIPLPQSLLASPTRLLPADLGEPELIVPGFVSALDVARAELLPGPTVTDEELVAVKALHPPLPAVAPVAAASTPFAAPVPHFVDSEGARAVLACTPYVPTPDPVLPIATAPPAHPGPIDPVAATPLPPPSFPASLHEAVHLINAVATEAPEPIPIAASLRNAAASLRASLQPAPLDRPGTLSQTSASLQREAVHLIADQEAFEALVHEHKQAFMADPDQRARIQWAAVRWMLHQLTLHDPLIFPGGGQSWEAVLLALIQKRLDRIALMEEDTLRAAAEARGFFLVIDADSLFHNKRARTEAPTGSKRTRSGSRAPSPVLPSPSLPPPPFQTVASEWEDGAVVPSSSEDMSDSSTPRGRSPASGAPAPALQDVGLLTQLPLDALPLPVLPPPPSPPTGVPTPAIEDVVVVEAPATVLMDTRPDAVGPQTTPTEWLPTDTEPAPSGTSVVLPVRSGVASSIHNPANVMAVETSEEEVLSAQGADRTHLSGDADAPVHVAGAELNHSVSGPSALPPPIADPVLNGILACMKDLAGAVSSLQREVADLRDCAGAEHRGLPAPAPQISAVAPSDPPLSVPAPAAGGPGTAASGQVPPQTRKRDVGGVPSGIDANGSKVTPRATVAADCDAYPALLSRPRVGDGVIPKPVTFAGVVTANAHRNNANAAAFTTAARQARPQPPAPSPAAITRLVVLRDGGVDDPAKEALLRSQTDKIVMQVRTSIQAVVSSPPFHVLSGSWARRASPGSKPAPTGNFTFTLAGSVAFQTVLPYARHFIAPLLKGVLYPGDKWAYAQIRGVPTKSPSGVIYDSPDLLAEIQRDPVMGPLQLINAPHWQGKVANLADREKSTVCIAFVDPSGSSSAALARATVSMFGARTPVLIMGDSPVIRQCGRCHELGHTTATCPKPAGFLRCFKCGGAHLETAHGAVCKGPHEKPGVCHCRYPCLLCGKRGHHARDRNCPKRGRLAPPPLESTGAVQRPSTLPAPPSAPAAPARADAPVAPPPPALPSTPAAATLLAPSSTPPVPVRVDDAPPYSPSRPQLPFTVVTRNRASKRARQRAAKASAASASAAPPAPAPAPSVAPVSTPTTTPAPSNGPTSAPAPAPAPLPPPPTTLLTDADSVARRAQWAAMEEPLPLYSIVDDQDLPPPEEVHNAYRTSLAARGILPTSPEYVTALDEIEVGWGGLPGDFDASISYRARYALSAGYPLTPTLVVDLFAGSSTGSQRDRILRDADIHLGGSGDGSALTPIAYFRKNAPWNLMFVEDSAPDRSDIPRLLHLCATSRSTQDFALLVEQWDYSFDGTGDGAALAAAYPASAWANAPGTLERILAVPRPNPTYDDPARRLSDAIARLSGPRAQPSPLSISRLLQRYCDWSDTPPSAFSQTTIELMAVEHTPFRPRVDGLPWHHAISPLVLQRLRA